MFKFAIFGILLCAIMAKDKTIDVASFCSRCLWL